MRIIPVLLLASSLVVALSAADDSCMPMASMTAISFEQGVTLTRRRNPNVPRMSCEGNCPSNAYLASAHCTQTGMSDNGLPSWKCVGNFPTSTDTQTYSLGTVSVRCEGCKKAGDPNVVKGSCQLVYSVEVNGGGNSQQQQQQQQQKQTTTTTTTTHHYRPGYYSYNGWWSPDSELLTGVFFVLLAIAVFMQLNGGNNGGGGGRGGGNNNNNGFWTGLFVGQFFGWRPRPWGWGWWDDYHYWGGPRYYGGGGHTTTTTTTTNVFSGGGGGGGGGGGSGRSNNNAGAGYGGSASL